MIRDDREPALAAPPAPPTAAPAAEGCPPPLQWQEVLAQWGRTSQPIAVEHRGVAVHGRADGSGPALLLLPGMLGSGELFCLLTHLLRAKIRCIALDYPDDPPRGPSPQPRSWRTWQLEDYAAVVEKLAAQHGEGEPLHLLGTGFGAAVALEAARRHPEVVGRLILLSACTQRRYSVVERALLTAARWLPGRIGSVPLWRPIQTRNHRRWCPPLDSSRGDWLLDDLGATSRAAFAARARLMERQGVPPAVAAQIRAPVLLVKAEGDGGLVDSCADAWAAALAQRHPDPGFREEWLHTTGQFAFVTHPHRLAKLLTGFLLP